MRHHSTAIPVLAVFLVAGANRVKAWETYHDPGLNDQGYCASCHPGFSGGRGDALHALHTGGTTPVTTNCNLCHRGSSRDNPLIMWSSGDGLGCTGCHGRDYGETIEANYLGFATAGKHKASGFGLRKHHLTVGVRECLDCHDDVQQEAILPENVTPPYYARFDVGIAGVPLDPCDNEDTANDGDSVGLDNDGDLLYDGADPDCQQSAPDINLLPLALDFGAVVTGESVTLSAQVQNHGTADLTVTLVTSCDGTSPEYTWSPEVEFAVAPGGSQALTVTYAPLDEGPDTGCLVIGSDDPDEPTVILDLAGSGTLPSTPDILLEPSSLDFGTVFIGDALRQSTQVRNGGTADLVVSGIELCAETSPEFAWSLSLPLTVPPGGSETLTVSYAPGDVGADTGCLLVLSDDPDQAAFELMLTGSGAELPVEEPNIALDPASLDFGTLFVGESGGLSAQLSNTGTADLVVSGIALCDGTSLEYSWIPEAPLTLPPGSSELVTVTYAPADLGPDVGCLAVVSNDPDAPTVTLNLTGTGAPVPEPEIVMDPSLLDFGPLTVGETRSLTSELRNTGTADLVISEIVLCEGTSFEYNWTLDPSATIPPGQSATVTVNYAPVDVGMDTGCLAIASNDPGAPWVELGLRGTGEQVVAKEPRIELDVPVVDFGTVFLGDAAERNAEVRNVGTADLVVSEIFLCEGTSSELGWALEAPVTIPPGGREGLTLTYVPADVGLDEGCLVVASNDPDLPRVEVGLRGNGAERPVAQVDLDIAKFTVTKRVKWKGGEEETVVGGGFIRIKLWIQNTGTESEPRPATVFGVQNGIEVYNETVMVSDAPDGKTSAFAFPSYRPTGLGDIQWIATISDDDPDVDEAGAVTTPQP